MAITKSAKKALRQSVKRKGRNLEYKVKLAKLLKEIKKLSSQGKKAEIKKLLPKVYKALDKTAKVGIIKKGGASRKKSRLAKLTK
ncbi:30S ribosomal protein S20 [Patescibacteria group bacterium]